MMPNVCLSAMLLFHAGPTLNQAASLSPRLTALRAELELGNRLALEAFWRETAVQGAPLVEPIDGDREHALLTFLWQAKGETRSVLLVGGPVGRWSPDRKLAQDQAMTRLRDTDVWYKTYRVRTDARLTYLFSPNDPLLTVDESGNPNELPASRQPDPLNPRRFVFPQDPEGPKLPTTVVSVVELPAAPPQPWVKPKPGVPAGKLEVHRLTSRILGNTRRVWVYTPPGYRRAGERYGLLLLFDGWDYTRYIPTPTILDNLLHDGRIAPLVAVMLDTPNRGRELPCYPPFVEFLDQELLPWVRERYHVTSDPRRTIVGGCSYGGLAATFCGLQRPDLFGSVLSQSGSFWWAPEEDPEPEWLARQFAAGPRLPLRFYLDVGLVETVPTSNDGPSQLIVNRHMRSVLKARGYPVHYAEFNGRHEFVNWQGALADGLIALVGKRAASVAGPQRPRSPARRSRE